jgi:hypothetical protein
VKIVAQDADGQVFIDDDTILVAWLGMLSEEERDQLITRALALQRQVNAQVLSAAADHRQDLIVRIALSHLRRPQNGHLP